MKKLVLLTLLVFGVSFGVIAQNNKPTTPNNNQVSSQAEITFEKLVHDYGEVPRNGNGETTFTYKNTGKIPLILSNVRSSCGCTVPAWSREPLMPGQSASIRVKYNTANPGPINKTVTVESNAKSARVVLRITGKVLN
ncbi:MAG: DUF1573 domain-containing protein [Bacteroidales bacterium]|mgnify:FL=1|jgi:archaellum component FlaG (FlaF/FlaG flagellin family)|nr:DUF1573 domain-containing protein [Bacteroidales bacterium]MDD4703942.1 DUF1573 domain-containing protein [Bacteroidales bacterium]MDX9798816.1 DUF1573 domain-containing protein [Bacteroidales bacterium]